MTSPVRHSSHPADAPVLDDILILDRRLPTRLVSFLGLNFAPMDPDTQFKRVCDAANRTDGFRYIATPNVDQIVRMNEQPHYKPFFEDAWVNVNDSRILEVLAGWSGLTLPACPGSDLAQRVLEQAIDPTEPVVIIGCSPEVIAAITRRIGLTDLRWHQPPMGLKNNPAAINAAAQFCVDNPARFTFLCVGGPQQEMVAQAIKITGRATGIGLCVGASLEFIAGTRTRAPLWMRRARLEWLFRLISEPKLLWRRYLIEGPKVFWIWWQWRVKQT